jgi:hypothetical protein
MIKTIKFPKNTKSIKFKTLSRKIKLTGKRPKKITIKRNGKLIREIIPSKNDKKKKKRIRMMRA